MNRFPEALRNRREELGFTQKLLAFRLGVSQPTVARWERGTNRPSGPVLVRMMKILRLSWDEVS